jgi:hypothetical protein
MEAATQGAVRGEAAWDGPEGTIRFDPERALVTLNDQRMLLLGADALGVRPEQVVQSCDGRLAADG